LPGDGEGADCATSSELRRALRNPGNPPRETRSTKGWPLRWPVRKGVSDLDLVADHQGPRGTTRPPWISGSPVSGDLGAVGSANP